MNKYLFILGLVGATLLSSCGSDELAVDDPIKISPEEERALVIEAGQDSEIPIVFGAIGNKRYATTRGSVESDDAGSFSTPDGTYLGVFCLATGKQNENQMINSILPATSSAINWTSHQYAKWLDNVPASVHKYEAADESPYPGNAYSEVRFMTNIETTPTRKYYYYPFGNWYHYNFYAYYPRVETPTIDASNVYADYTITGKEDIIQGVASVTDNTYILDHALPYCAKYFRLKNGGSLTTAFADLPTLDLQHKLTKIVVVVKPHDATHAHALFDRGIKLKNVQIDGVYKDLRLCVASKSSSDPNPTGQLTKKSNATSGTLSIWKEADDTNPFSGGEILIALADNDATATTIGYAMLPPTSLLGTNEKYMIKLEMVQNSGDDLPDFSVVLENTDGSSMTLEAGHSYTITLDIYSPSEIYVKATLRDWVNESPTIIEVD